MRLWIKHFKDKEALLKQIALLHNENRLYVKGTKEQLKDLILPEGVRKEIVI